jgi:hypothetical protein
VPTAPMGPPVAGERLTAPPEVIPAGITLPESVPAWQALLDVSIWRSRPWWWRVAASLVVKRLNR